MSFLKAWSEWIRQIANDSDMDRSRLIEHLQIHIKDHMPDSDAHPDRWNQWLAGTYNLLAILSAMVGCNPSFELGVARLFRKWQQHPFDHTAPPKVEIYREISELGKTIK
ncbi:MAG: hypothetical protein DWQ19_11400 [Crenarchaeota archaeon]|nr:MAG: hypothetical protein DWQ19_11400 [Thermoproteota archaeon]